VRLIREELKEAAARAARFPFTREGISAVQFF
jgi:hypothetical protein